MATGLDAPGRGARSGGTRRRSVEVDGLVSTMTLPSTGSTRTLDDDRGRGRGRGRARARARARARGKTRARARANANARGRGRVTERERQEEGHWNLKSSMSQGRQFCCPHTAIASCTPPEKHSWPRTHSPHQSATQCT
eukprot:2608907-Rhodomonas_salina.1